MASTDLPAARDLLGQHWPSFVAAVYDPVVRGTPGGVQMYVWQTLSNYYLSRGESLPSGAFGAVNTLLSLAGQQRRAGQELSQSRLLVERTGIDQAMHNSFIAPAIDTGPLAGRPLGPQYRVTFQTTEIVGGQEVLSYRTHDLGYDLPQSLSGLQDTIEESAQVQAQDYGYEWGGVATPVSILSY